MSLGRLCSQSFSRSSFTLPQYSQYRSNSTQQPSQNVKRKRVYEGLLVDPQTLEQIKEYRSAVEWHIFKRRFEKPLMEAYEKFLQEAEEQKTTEKKQKRRERKDEMAEYRRRQHLVTLRKQEEWKEGFITRTWEKSTQAMKDTLDWSALTNPFSGRIDSVDQDLTKFAKPESILPMESWLFHNRHHWKEIPFLSNIFAPPENSLSWILADSIPNHATQFYTSDSDETPTGPSTNVQGEKSSKDVTQVQKPNPMKMNAKSARLVINNLQRDRDELFSAKDSWIQPDTIDQDEVEPPAPSKPTFANVVPQKTTSTTSSTVQSILEEDWFIQPKHVGFPDPSAQGDIPLPSVIDEVIARDSPVDSGAESTGPDSDMFEADADGDQIVAARKEPLFRPDSILDSALNNEGSPVSGRGSTILETFKEDLEELFASAQPDEAGQNFKNMIENVQQTLQSMNNKNLSYDLQNLKSRLDSSFQNASSTQRVEITKEILDAIREEVSNEMKLSTSIYIDEDLAAARLLEDKLFQYGILVPEDYSNIPPATRSRGDHPELDEVSESDFDENAQHSPYERTLRVLTEKINQGPSSAYRFLFEQDEVGRHSRSQAFGAPAPPTRYMNALQAPNNGLPKIPPLDYEKLQQESSPAEPWIKSDKSERLQIPVVSPSTEMQSIYSQAVYLKTIIPSEEQIQQLLEVSSPKYIDNVLKGAKRAGVDEKHIEFLKLSAMSRIPHPEKVREIQAYLSNNKAVNEFIQYAFDNANTDTSSNAFEYAPDSDGDIEKQEHAEYSAKVKQNVLENTNSRHTRALVRDTPAEFFVEEPIPPLPSGRIEVSDNESEVDENESMVISGETTKFYIEYAHRLKNFLEHQMKEQLRKYELLADDDDPDLMKYDPPQVGVDVVPCVEIIHTTHIQSLTNYSTLQHVQRRVVFKINVSLLDLPLEVKERLIEIVGTRYNPETGIFKFIADTQPNKHQNTIYGVKQIQKIFEAAYEASPYYIPLSDVKSDPVDSVGDCPVQVSRLSMPEKPEISSRPWQKEQRLKPFPTQVLFRTYPFGWQLPQLSTQ